MTLKQAIVKICDILEHPEYPQIKGSLVNFDSDGNIIGKCALGEISCKVGLKLTQENPDRSFSDILKAAGVPKWALQGNNLPHIYRQGESLVLFETDIMSQYNLDYYIWKMNDANYTYTDISEFLRCTFL